MNTLISDALTAKNMRKSVTKWIRAHDQYAHGFSDFSRMEGLDYWAVWVDVVGKIWGMHVYDDGRIEHITTQVKSSDYEGC